MILKGTSGAGKTTFVKTIGLFRDGVVTESIAGHLNVGEELQKLQPSDAPRVIILEGREALGEVAAPALEGILHSVNSFIRSRAGRLTLVIWPVNTPELASILTRIADSIGAESLFGPDEAVHIFLGPPKEEFISIAERTIGTLNEGASLSALGISHDQAVELVTPSPTIGSFLSHVRKRLLENIALVNGLMPKESLRLWTVVLAGNDPEGAVEAVTRGGHALADIDRMMTATGANIVAELKKTPDRIGILSTVLDARVLYLDTVTALAVARQYGDADLKELMRAKGMSTSSDASAATRLRDSGLGQLLQGGTLGTGKRGPKTGPDTKAAFNNLAQIARTNDIALNRAIGAGLADAGLIERAETERMLGTEFKYKSDLYCERSGLQPVRLEMMWRARAGRADISNYVLGKLAKYGRAMGLL
ncbi:Uncharacterised protein [Rhodococcus coprophilus]|uniref:Uncharacterized protein n=2 Tax=Rhodococcus coprophilus TaxID=38310 RepID=A0A2X4USE5_9NOCA|nr:Uncharacterised protein [Rhodococcus coprophilus]